jgi:hypothetical protein
MTRLPCSPGSILVLRLYKKPSMSSSCRSCHHATRTWLRWPPGPSNEAYLSSPHLEASPATTFRACFSPAPTSVKPQPAPAILRQESVHTMLSITYHTRKRSSIGPWTTYGPQSPPWWEHWQHTHIVTLEKRKRKETNKKKLQQAIESQRKGKEKDHLKKTSLGPLMQGQRLDTSRTKLCSRKERKPPNQNSKTTKSSPCAHARSPWTNATPPGRKHANHLMKNRAAASTQLWPVRPVATTGQTGAQHVHKTSTPTGQTGVQQSPEIARNNLKTF